MAGGGYSGGMKKQKKAEFKADGKMQAKFRMRLADTDLADGLNKVVESLVQASDERASSPSEVLRMLVSIGIDVYLKRIRTVGFHHDYEFSADAAMEPVVRALEAIEPRKRGRAIRLIREDEADSNSLPVFREIDLGALSEGDLSLVARARRLDSEFFVTLIAWVNRGNAALPGAGEFTDILSKVRGAAAVLETSAGASSGLVRRFLWEAQQDWKERKCKWRQMDRWDSLSIGHAPVAPLIRRRKPASDE